MRTILTVAILAVSLPAWATTPTPAPAGAVATSGPAVSHSTSHAVTSSRQSVTVQTAPAGGSGQGGRVPDVLAPSITTANPCGAGVGLGGSGAGGGGFLSFLWGEKRCERRQDAITMHRMGDTPAAREVLCLNDDVRWARLRAGDPCKEDRDNGWNETNSRGKLPSKGGW